MVDHVPQVEVAILGTLGALLILVDGVGFAAGAFGSAPIQFTGNALAVAGGAAVLTFALAAFLVAYWDETNAEDQSIWGAAIVIVGACSLWVGGGFLVGFVLAVTAGVLAIVLARLPGFPERPYSPPPRHGLGRGLPRLSGPSTPPEPGASEPSPPSGVSWASTVGGMWFCGNCAAVNPIGAQTCAKCGAPKGSQR